ncbi:MAG: type II secretion system F family protein [candidate division Zixibacteria bacterium]|nr:type II secretion system F family protein [candidate division Zixibacteria bacterium]
MPVFTYKGRTLAGTLVSGELKTKNRAELERTLRTKKILVTSVSTKPSQINLRIGTGIKKVHISRFTRQFATMIGAGLPMVQCLEILSQQMEAAELRRVIGEVKESVQAGTTLAEALSRHKKVFDDLYVNMVDAGEIGGALDIILVRLAIYREKADALARKVKGAMIYPAVVMTVAIAVTFIMLTYIVPIFARMFAGLGAELPAPTQFILSLSAFLRANFLTGLGLLIALIIAYKYYSKTQSGRLNIDRVKLKLPLLGDLIRKSAIARFSRTLSTLISSGVSILDALDITARTSGNRVIHDAIKKSILSIAEGETITQPLKESKVFPPMVVQMISVGEKTGGLDEMLSKIADFYDEEVDAAVAALTSVIEPVIIVFMGIVIGGILIAMYLPMFEIIGKIS